MVLGYAYNQYILKGYSDDSTEIVFEVSPGQNMKTVSENLENQNLVKSGELFFYFAKFKGANAKLKRGEYAIRPNMSASEIISVVTSGKSLSRNFTVIEGSTIFDIADTFEKNGFGQRDEFLQLIQDPTLIKSLLGEDATTLEGYLFPETYKFTKFEGAKDIITQMVRKFQTTWKELEPLTKSIGWSQKKVVTFASIVEKETGLAQDRALVSSVFHNRLKKGMKLQTDPTILYGIAIDRWKKNIRPEILLNISKADLLRPHPYNSYTQFGLPPTPISNPGRHALEAALSPANTKYLYFVSRNDGTTHFSETLEAHNLGVNAFQRNVKARDGKSWRNLNKKSQ